MSVVLNVISAFDNRGFKQAETGLGKVGSTLTKTLTPAAAALGLGFKKAFSEFDSGADALRASTGATGKALDSLVGSMKNVAGNVTEPMSEVGAVMGELNKRTGQTGKSLETLTQRTLELARLQGGDAIALSESMTRVFGDWSVATKDQASAMDALFRASQATGPPVSRLSELVVKFGSPLRQLGFGFEETAALLGKFEGEGVNTELVMGSMRIALGKMAKAGAKDLPAALAKSIREIKNAKSAGDATRKAFELFGARAGADMAAAIREGRFELGDLFKEVTSGKETITRAAQDTLDWSDKLAMLKNRAIGVVGPVGEIGMAAAGVAAGLGPAALGISKMAGAFGFLGSAVGAAGKAMMVLAANPVVLVIAAIVAAGIAIYVFRDKIATALRAVGRFFSSVFGAIRSIVRSVWNWIKSATAAVFNGLRAYFGTVLGIFRTIFTTAWNAIRTAVVVPLRAVKDFIGGTLRRIREIWSGAWGGMRDVFARVWSGVAGLARGAVNGVVGVLNGLIRIVESAINTLIRAYNKVAGLPLNPMPKVGEVSLPRIPSLNVGGTITQMGLARVHKDELLHLPVGASVIPLPRARAASGGVTIINNIQGSVISSGDLAQLIRNELLKTKKRNSRLGL